MIALLKGVNGTGVVTFSTDRPVKVLGLSFHAPGLTGARTWVFALDKDLFVVGTDLATPTYSYGGTGSTTDSLPAGDLGLDGLVFEGTLQLTTTDNPANATDVFFLHVEY